MNQHPAAVFFVSIVSFHEQVLGWNAYIARARDTTGVSHGYQRLHDLLEYFKDVQVLPFDQAAVEVFDTFNIEHLR